MSPFTFHNMTNSSCSFFFCPLWRQRKIETRNEIPCRYTANRIFSPRANLFQPAPFQVLLSDLAGSLSTGSPRFIWFLMAWRKHEFFPLLIKKGWQWLGHHHHHNSSPENSSRSWRIFLPRLVWKSRNLSNRLKFSRSVICYWTCRLLLQI